MVIDAYSHVCPAPLLEAIGQAAPSAEAGALRNSYLWDADRRLRYMDGVGIDVQALVLVRPPMWLGMDRPTMYRLTRIANDSIAALAAAHPDRFIGVGVLPAVDDVLTAEFCRLTDELGLPGVVIFSHVDGKPLDDASMWPLYAEAASRNAPIWIHPQHGHSYPWLQENMLDRLFGWPFETTLAMARLVYGGVLERYPQLAFVTHHLGGMVPYYANRIDSMDHVAGPPGSSDAAASGNGLSRPARDYFKLFYNDTMVHGSLPALTCGLEFFSADHIMFGTDFPMGPEDGEKGPVQVLESLRQLDVSEADRELILGGNLLRLLGRG